MTCHLAATEVCTASIEKNKGKLVVKEAARTVSDRDDRLLAEKMEALENANKWVWPSCWGSLCCMGMMPYLHRCYCFGYVC